jgi:hypothetical protein
LNYKKIARSLRKLESIELMVRKKRFGNSTEYELICPRPDSPIPTISPVLHPSLGESSEGVQTNKTDVTKIDNNKKGHSPKIVLPNDSGKSTDELWASMPSASEVNEIRDNGLIPILNEEKHLFDALNVERAARNYVAFGQFKTTKQRGKFRECIDYFNGETNIQVDEIISNGKRDIDGVVNALHWRLREARKKIPSYRARAEDFMRPENIAIVDMSKVTLA